MNFFSKVMMWAIAKRNERRLRKKSDRNIKLLSLLSSNAATFDKLEKTQLILWNEKDRRLFVSEPVATLMLSQGYESWCNFVRNAFLWQFGKQQSEAWHNQLINHQMKAVRDYRKAHPTETLTTKDIVRIKLEAKATLDYSEGAKPKVSPFEFFILYSLTSNPADAHVQWVGTFDPETDDIQMASWEELKLEQK